MQAFFHFVVIYHASPKLQVSLKRVGRFRRDSNQYEQKLRNVDFQHKTFLHSSGVGIHLLMSMPILVGACLVGKFKHVVQNVTYNIIFNR